MGIQILDGEDPSGWCNSLQMSSVHDAYRPQRYRLSCVFCSLITSDVPKAWGAAGRLRIPAGAGTR